MFLYFVFASLLLQIVICKRNQTCGPEGHCTCYEIHNEQHFRNFAIDCSGTNLPTNSICDFIKENTKYRITKLMYMGNSYSDINSFEGCQQIKELILSYNGIRQIINLFSPLKNLQLLDLSYNDLDIFGNDWNLEFMIPLTVTTLMLNGNVNEIGQASINLRYPYFGSLPLLNELSLDGLPELNINISANATNNIKVLSLSGFSGFCNMSYVTTETFSFFERLRVLNLSDCNLKYIETGSLKSLAYLEVLDVSFNTELGFRALENTSWDLQFTNIKVLNFSKVYNTFGLGTIVRKRDLCYLRNTTLREIVLDSNRLQLFETNSVLLFPESLEIIRLNDNTFTFGPYLLQTGCVLNVREVYASYQNKAHAPFKYGTEKQSDQYDKCDTGINQTNMCPFMAAEFLKNISINLNATGCKFYDSEVIPVTYPSLPKRVRKVFFHNCGMNYDLIRFLITPFDNKIEEFDVSGNVFTRWIGPVGPLKHLKRLVLSNTYCSYISSDIFEGNLDSLENLQIQQNFIGLAFEDYGDKPSVFRDLLSLKTLNLSTNRIRTMPPNTFFNLINLETLDLSFNNIEDLAVNISTMPNLTHLNLSSNFITYLPKVMIYHLENVSRKRKVNFTLNLSNNPILCSCKNKDFLNWVLRHKDNMNDYSYYVFMDEDRNQLTVKEFEKYVQGIDKSCTSYFAMILLCSILLTLFMSIVIGGFVYKNRWKLRYLLYMSKQRYFGYRHMPNEEPIENFKYDAFISYANENLRFVIKSIIPNLEQEGLALCIHQRDFLPGNTVADNIIDAIQSSRRSIVLLTQAFLKSKWCMYEFNMARMESIYSRDDKGCLLIVLLEKIPMKKMPLEMLNWLRYQSYLEYTEEAEGEALFWHNLRDAIKASTLKLTRNYGATNATVL